MIWNDGLNQEIKTTNKKIKNYKTLIYILTFILFAMFLFVLWSFYKIV